MIERAHFEKLFLTLLILMIADAITIKRCAIARILLMLSHGSPLGQYFY